MATAEDIEIVNAAIASTGGSPISSFTDGSQEAQTASNAYEQMVRAELVGGRWAFAEKDSALSRSASDPLTGDWTYSYGKPADLLQMLYVEENGGKVDYELVGDYIFSNAGPTRMRARYLYRAPASEFTPGFVAAMTVRLEALFLRSIEHHAEAQERDTRADRMFIVARTRDDQQNPPRRVTSSRLVDARRG